MWGQMKGMNLGQNRSGSAVEVEKICDLSTRMSEWGTPKQLGSFISGPKGPADLRSTSGPQVYQRTSGLPADLKFTS